MNKQTAQQLSSFPAVPARAKCPAPNSPDLLWSLCGWPGAGPRVQVQEAVLGQPLWQRAPPPLWESSRGSRTDPQWDQGWYCSHSRDLESAYFRTRHCKHLLTSTAVCWVEIQHMQTHVWLCDTDCATVAGSALHFPAGFACTEQQCVCCCPQCV